MMVAAYINEHDYMHNLAVNYKNKEYSIAIIIITRSTVHVCHHITVIYSTIYKKKLVKLKMNSTCLHCMHMLRMRT